MTGQHNTYVWPRPPIGIHRNLWVILAQKIARSRWARHYCLSRDIGRRRTFIGGLRRWSERCDRDENRRDLLHQMIRDERVALVAVIKEREALWRS